jgi:hypothetical protein
LEEERKADGRKTLVLPCSLHVGSGEEGGDGPRDTAGDEEGTGELGGEGADELEVDGKDVHLRRCRRNRKKE